MSSRLFLVPLLLSIVSVAYCQEKLELQGTPFLLADVNKLFMYEIKTTGGVGTVTLDSTGLPPDLRLQNSMITGIPKNAGLFQFTIRAQDALNNIDTKIFNIAVGGAQTPVSPVPPAIPTPTPTVSPAPSVPYVPSVPSAPYVPPSSPVHPRPYVPFVSTPLMPSSLGQFLSNLPNIIDN